MSIAVSLDFFVDELDEIDEIKSPIIKIILDWCKDDKGKNIMYKKNGDDNSYSIPTGYDKNGKLIKGIETLWDGFEIKSGCVPRLPYKK